MASTFNRTSLYNEFWETRNELYGVVDFTQFGTKLFKYIYIRTYAY